MREGWGEDQYDLLTAAAIGILVGVGATLLLRRGPSGRRPLGQMAGGIAVGARRGGKAAARMARRAPLPGRRRGRFGGVSVDDITDEIRDTLEGLRDAVTDTVASELGGLRKAVRKQRRRFGV